MKQLLIKFSSILLGVVLVFDALAGSAMRDNSPDELEQGWHFVAAPYLWMSQFSGPVTLFGNRRVVSMPFSNIFTNFDFAYQGHFEAGNGPWSIIVDPAYLPVSRASSQVNDRLSMFDLDFAAYYRIFSRYTSDDRYLSWELMGGGRYFSASGDLYYLSTTALTIDRSTSASVIAPILGLRMKYEFSPKLNLWLTGDVGGFGIDNFNNTWSVALGLSYLVHRYIRVAAQYKLLKVNFSQPSFAMDGLMYGPMIGVIFSSNSR